MSNCIINMNKIFYFKKHLKGRKIKYLIRDLNTYICSSHYQNNGNNFLI